MSHRSTPPLRAVVAFEAAARHGSFTGAAIELGVSHGAISRQVGKLEQELGLTLFHRHHRRVELTAAGERYALEVAAAMKLLREATKALRRELGDKTLVFSTSPAFAGRFLIHKLPALSELSPAFEYRMTTSHLPLNYVDAGVDCGIRFGDGGWPDVVAELLRTEDLVPVAHPSVATRSGSPDAPKASLLNEVDTRFWTRWLEEQGASSSPARVGPIFNDYNVLLEAAVGGQGIVLGQMLLIGDEISRGSLVPVPGWPGTKSFGYYLCHPSRPAKPILVQRFKHWLKTVLQAAGASGFGAAVLELAPPAPIKVRQ